MSRINKDNNDKITKDEFYNENFIFPNDDSQL